MSDARNPRYDNEHQLVTTWADDYHVNAMLVPFKHRKHDPWEVMNAIREQVESLPETAATWRISKTEYSHQITTPQIRRFMLACIGSYPVTKSNGKHSRLANPNYLHHENRRRTCVLPKEKQVKRCARTGLLGQREVAAMYGESQKSLYRYCNKHGIDFHGLKQQGRERTANAMLISNAWAGHTTEELGRILGMSQNRASEWINHVATLEDAPEYPNEQWAATDSGYFVDG